MTVTREQLDALVNGEYVEEKEYLEFSQAAMRKADVLRALAKETFEARLNRLTVREARMVSLALLACAPMPPSINGVQFSREEIVVLTTKLLALTEDR